MSQSPTTPNKPSGGAGKMAASSADMPAVYSSVVRSSLHEPSPASTYGETTAGDSIPATPQDVECHGKSSIDALPTSALLMFEFPRSLGGYCFVIPIVLCLTCLALSCHTIRLLHRCFLASFSCFWD